MKLINVLDDYFFGDEPHWADRLWFYGSTALMSLIAAIIVF
ncbi:hypothetical protein [Viridibacillus sp. FSL H8-0123]|nr:hypothetical protein [Viridibacillus sp. FSL H8-0123]